MQKTGSEHATIGHNDRYHKGQNYQAKDNRNMKKQQQQKKKTKGQRNQHHKKDGGRHYNRGGSHQTKSTSRKGGGDGKHKDGKQVSKALGCAWKNRYYPSAACYLLNFK